jgi:hypothetical protein
MAPIFFQERDEPIPIASYDLSRVVGGAVVNHDYLETRVRLI